jgi:hypothetical protein
MPNHAPDSERKGRRGIMCCVFGGRDQRKTLNSGPLSDRAHILWEQQRKDS